MISIAPSARVEQSAELRVRGDGQIIIADDAVIDARTRIIAAEGFIVHIGRGAKVGLGSVINGGCHVTIEDGAALYGYCYVQASVWELAEDGSKLFRRAPIVIGKGAKIYQFSSLFPGTVIAPGGTVLPNSIVGAPEFLPHNTENSPNS